MELLNLFWQEKKIARINGSGCQLPVKWFCRLSGLFEEDIFCDVESIKTLFFVAVFIAMPFNLSISMMDPESHPLAHLILFDRE